MESLLLKIGPIIKIASYALMGIVIAATIVAKVTPTPKDDTVVSKVAKYVLKAIKFLPTIGVNPSTKKLEEAYAKLNGEENVEVSKPS